MLRGWLAKKKQKKIIKRLGFIGKKVYIDYSTLFVFPEKISLQDYVHIQNNCSFYGGGGITVGEGTIFAHEVQVLSQNHNYDSPDLEYIPYDRKQVNKTVEIGKYVWVGSRVTILPGVHIGDGAVIGAGSVVTKDIPSCAIVGGNPAIVLKYRDRVRFKNLLDQRKGYIENCK